MTTFEDVVGQARVAAPLRQQTIDACRNAIAAGLFAPGQRLIEQDLCERLSVSRSVVREALRYLEAEGLVTVIANRGPVVATLTAEEAKSLFELRGLLEGFAGQLCAERGTPAQKRDLRATLERVREAMAERDMVKLLRVKDQFYAALTAGAQNPFIVSALRTIHARAQVFRALSLSAPGRSADSLVELDGIVSAIEAGDPVAARQACEQHVRNAGQVALARLPGAEAGKVADHD